MAGCVPCAIRIHGLVYVEKDAEIAPISGPISGRQWRLRKEPPGAELARGRFKAPRVCLDQLTT